MWTRDELKNRAKAVLSRTYWMAFLVSLVLTLVTSTGSSNSDAQQRVTIRMPGSDLLDADWLQGYLGFIENQAMPSILPLLMGGISLAAIFFLLVRLFVGYNLEVGCRRFFTSASVGHVDLGILGFGFQNQRYWNIFCTMLYRGVINFLWYLLLIIPGIVKSYAYSMVPYILADNPEIHYHRALQLSNEMTRGHKFDMFVLDLSFIGWYLLGALACGVGVYFVNPYRDSTMAELYLNLRHNAIMNGITTPQELWLG